MRVVLKPIFDWITGNYNLFDNSMYNYIAMGLVGLVAFIIAWNFVGQLYQDDFISGSTMGSIIH